MAGLISLCTDVIVDSEKSDDPVLLDCLLGLKNHNVFGHADDEGLKAGLKCINHLLNEPKTCSKGLLLLDNFVTQIDTSRLVRFQESLQSTLNLLTKCLELDLTHKILGVLLPMCHKIPEINQLIVSTIVPKLLSHFVDNSNSSRLTNTEEIKLLLSCMERYRGPCGQYRQQLERIIIPAIDLHYQDEIAFENIAKMFPLLSAIGGGGNKGEKYGQDWSDTVTKILNASYDTLVCLLEDICPQLDAENPYVLEGGQSLNLSNIRHSNVLMRMSLTNRRLLNLTRILASFLVEPFPAPKSVPIRGILNLLANMTMVNPLSLLKSKGDDDNDSVVPRENINLANMLPAVHLAALELLDKVILSCGSQLYPDASRLELLLLQEFKWIQEKPSSFENLKTQLYRVFKSWLTVTKGSISNNKNATVLTQHIMEDIKIDKQNVVLVLGVKSKKGKKKQKQGATLFNPSNSNNVDVKEVTKSGVVCTVALQCLDLLIPTLDFPSHRAAYLTLATTVGDFTESSDYPSPYNISECRRFALKCLVQLAMNPNPKSPVSLGLITCLVELGTRDESHTVATDCHQMLSALERIIHPSAGTLQFPPISAPLPATNTTNKEQQLPVMEKFDENIHYMDADDSQEEEDEEEDIQHFSNRVETDNQSDDNESIVEVFSNTINENNNSTGNVSSSSITLDPSILKDYVAQALRENLELILNQKRRKLYFEDSDDDCVIYDHRRSQHSNDTTRPNNNNHLGLVKDIENEKLNEIEEPPCKKVKTWTTGNEISSSGSTATSTPTDNNKGKDDGVSVTVEEILLNFDDNIVLPEG